MVDEQAQWLDKQMQKEDEANDLMQLQTDYTEYHHHSKNWEDRVE